MGVITACTVKSLQTQSQPMFNLGSRMYELKRDDYTNNQAENGCKMRTAQL